MIYDAKNLTCGMFLERVMHWSGYTNWMGTQHVVMDGDIWARPAKLSVCSGYFQTQYLQSSHPNHGAILRKRFEMRTTATISFCFDRLPYLVGGFGTWMLFSNIFGNFIIPTGFHMFQRGRWTTNQNWLPFSSLIYLLNMEIFHSFLVGLYPI